MKDDEMEYKEMIEELKTDRKQENKISEKFAIDMLLIIFTIRSNYIIRFIGDFISAIIALIVLLWVGIETNDLLCGVCICILIHIIWSYLRGDESGIMNMIAISINLIISIEVARISLWGGLIIYLILHMACVALKESF